MFRISEPYTLQDSRLLLVIFIDYHRLLSIFVNRSQSINYFFLRDFDFYRFPVSIDNNQRIKSIISHNF